MTSVDVSTTSCRTLGHFRDDGAQVAILEYAAEKVSALREEFGHDVLVVQGDVRNITDLVACRDAIADRYGRLNCLVGAQGIFDGNVRLADIPVERVDALFDEDLSINVKGYVLTTRVFLDMLTANDGAVVLTASKPRSRPTAVATRTPPARERCGAW